MMMKFTAVVFSPRYESKEDIFKFHCDFMIKLKYMKKNYFI